MYDTARARLREVPCRQQAGARPNTARLIESDSAPLGRARANYRVQRADRFFSCQHRNASWCRMREAFWANMRKYCPLVLVQPYDAKTLRKMLAAFALLI